MEQKTPEEALAELEAEVNKVFLRPIAYPLFFSIFLFLASFFIWIWAGWYYGWRTALSAILLYLMSAIAHYIMKGIIKHSLKEAVSDLSKEQPTSLFKQKIAELVAKNQKKDG